VSDRSAQAFYDGLAEDYHLIFDDWWSAAQRQGEVLAELLGSEGVVPPARVLDCTCGIGTQALPLALLGYDVSGTDISGASIDRAKQEALSRGAEIPLTVADVRDLPTHFAGSFDVVISCDNALPHLLNDTDLFAALSSIRRSLKSGGLLLATMRDYDSLRSERNSGIAPAIVGSHGNRHAYAQAWHWSEDGSFVDVSLFVLSETSDGWQASVHETTYRALLRGEMDTALTQAGFSALRWLMPPASHYYQPIVIARVTPT